jgi:hypothetical protein
MAMQHTCGAAHVDVPHATVPMLTEELPPPALPTPVLSKPALAPPSSLLLGKAPLPSSPLAAPPSLLLALKIDPPQATIERVSEISATTRKEAFRFIQIIPSFTQDRSSDKMRLRNRGDCRFHHWHEDAVRRALAEGIGARSRLIVAACLDQCLDLKRVAFLAEKRIRE